MLNNAQFTLIELHMREWSNNEIKDELWRRSERDGNGNTSYNLSDLESLIRDPRFPKRTNDDYIERIRALVESKKKRF